MRCPSCGYEIATQSPICPSCRRNIPANGWEYCDFVFAFPPKSMFARLTGEGALNELEARMYFWQNVQGFIHVALRQWLDDGWQPLAEIGPASILVSTYRRINLTAAHILYMILTAFPTFGFSFILVPLFFARYHYAEPAEFRLSMRRFRRGF